MFKRKPHQKKLGIPQKHGVEKTYRLLAPFPSSIVAIRRWRCLRNLALIHLTRYPVVRGFVGLYISRKKRDRKFATGRRLVRRAFSFLFPFSFSFFFFTLVMSKLWWGEKMAMTAKFWRRWRRCKNCDNLLGNYGWKSRVFDSLYGSPFWFLWWWDRIVVALTGKSHSAALGTIPQDLRSWAKGAKSGNNNVIVYQPQCWHRSSHMKTLQHCFPFVDSSSARWLECCLGSSCRQSTLPINYVTIHLSMVFFRAK